MNGRSTGVVAKAWRLACGMLMSAYITQAAVAAAAVQAPSSPESDWEVHSVRELMRQDLQQALEGSAGQTGATTAGRGDGRGPAVPKGSTAVPQLVALYGVGRALMAEVQVGREAYLYVRGQTHPAGYRGDASVYQLRGMNGACVQLQRGEERHSLCLRMLLGGQP